MTIINGMSLITNKIIHVIAELWVLKSMKVVIREGIEAMATPMYIIAMHAHVG